MLVLLLVVDVGVWLDEVLLLLCEVTVEELDVWASVLESGPAAVDRPVAVVVCWPVAIRRVVSALSVGARVDKVAV